MWSPPPPSADSFVPPAAVEVIEVASLQLNEVAYDPMGSDAGREWLEIKNVGATSFDISATRQLSIYLDTRRVGLTYVAGPERFAPNCYLIIARDPANLPAPPESTCVTTYRGSLTLPNRLVNLRWTIDSTTDVALGSYDPLLGGRGDGRTLERDPAGAWRASMEVGGTPGADFRVSKPVSPPRVVISQFSAVPEAGELESVTLVNRDTRPVDLTGWQIDDRVGGSKPYRFPTSGSQLLGVGEERVLRASETHLSLTNTGDELWLRDSTGQVVDYISYGRLARGTIWRRGVDGIGEWVSSPGQTDEVSDLIIAPIVRRGDASVEIIDQTNPQSVRLDQVPPESGWHVAVEGTIQESHARSAVVTDGVSTLLIRFRLASGRKPAIHRGDYLRVQGVVDLTDGTAVVVKDPEAISVTSTRKQRSKPQIKSRAELSVREVVRTVAQSSVDPPKWQKPRQSFRADFSTIWPVLGMLGGLFGVAISLARAPRLINQLGK